MEREDQVGTCLSKIERLEKNIKDKNEAITGLMSDNQAIRERLEAYQSQMSNTKAALALKS